jgi:hypothetical protein
VATLLAVAASQALASQPQTFSNSFIEIYAISCPYGDLTASTMVDEQGFLFLEPTGQATQLKIMLNVTTTIANPINSKAATGQQHTRQTLCQKSADWVGAGVNMSIRVPGIGDVLQVASKVVTDFHGNLLNATPLFDKASTAPLCNALQRAVGGSGKGRAWRAT